MRYTTEQTAAWTQALCTSFERSPESWEYWECLHYDARDVARWSPEKLVTILDDHFNWRLRRSDGQVILSEDGDILILYRAVERADLQEAMAGIHRHMHHSHAVASHMCIYSMPRDYAVITHMLHDKLDHTPANENAMEMLFPASDAHIAERLQACFDVLSPELEKRPHRQPMQVLLVEDDDLTRRIAARSLKDAYALITASSAQEAMTGYLLHAPDIVFLDIGLPDVCGFDVMHELLRHDPEAYIVLFSGSGNANNIMHGLCCGARGFVSKPFRRETLVHHIEACARERGKHPAYHA